VGFGWLNRAFLLGLLIPFVGLDQASAGAAWNAAGNFSTTNGNPNGAWTYGAVESSTFYLDDYVGGGPSPAYWYEANEAHVWVNTLSTEQYGILPGQLSLHPGTDGGASVIRWTAPAGVTPFVQVQGQFSQGDSATKQVGIFVDGIPTVTTPYWQSVDSGAFDFSLPVTPGATIDFASWGAWISGDTALDVSITSLVPGDANEDGRVDINDLTIVLAHYNQTGMVWTQGEFTGDGTVDINDLTIVLANYGTSSGAGIAAVPEPSCVVLLSIGLITLLGCAWRRRAKA
jgi:hypothetical protein